MSTPARFGVDPEELLAAAAAAGEVVDSVAVARQALVWRPTMLVVTVRHRRAGQSYPLSGSGSTTSWTE